MPEGNFPLILLIYILTTVRTKCRLIFLYIYMKLNLESILQDDWNGNVGIM
jgi:hypothetical protein